jgi:hypothetical protein
MTDGGDSQAVEHLEGCTACFEALEAGDPIVHLLVAARPAETPVPADLASAVLKHWHPRRARLMTTLTTGLAIAAALVAVGIEVLVGAEPSRLADLAPGLVDAAAGWIGGELTAAQTVQSILLGAPAVLALMTAVTIVTCAVWLKLARSLPNWKPAS